VLRDSLKTFIHSTQRAPADDNSQSVSHGSYSVMANCSASEFARPHFFALDHLPASGQSVHSRCDRTQNIRLPSRHSKAAFTPDTYSRIQVSRFHCNRPVSPAGYLTVHPFGVNAVLVHTKSRTQSIYWQLYKRFVFAESIVQYNYQDYWLLNLTNKSHQNDTEAW